MKKNLWAFIAVFLAIGASILQSYSSKPVRENPAGDDTYDWYPVNSSNQVSSTTAVYTDVTKASAISSNGCKDQKLPNCLYGTNGSVTLGLNIASEPADQRIRIQN